jgi:hypothetical protein
MNPDGAQRNPGFGEPVSRPSDFAALHPGYARYEYSLRPDRLQAIVVVRFTTMRAVMSFDQDNRASKAENETLAAPPTTLGPPAPTPTPSPTSNVPTTEPVPDPSAAPTPGPTSALGDDDDDDDDDDDK